MHGDGAFPRYYFASNGLFGTSACNEQLVQSLDVTPCKDNRKINRLENFLSLEQITRLPTLPRSVVAMASKPYSNLTFIGVNRMDKYGVLDLSGVGMVRLPTALKHTLMKHRDDNNIVKLDISNNALDGFAISEIFRTLGCPSKMGLSLDFVMCRV